MNVQIPGVAFRALEESSFPSEQADTWENVVSGSRRVSRGKGFSVDMDISEDDARTIRAGMLLMVRKLNSQPYPMRGMEGSVNMYALQTAMGRIDDALIASEGHLDLSRSSR